jgi:hypothetical protein
MRQQIAAANWKMNLTYQQAEALLDAILDAGIDLYPHQQVIFAVPFPYLIMAKSEVAEEPNYFIAAQNCSDKRNGAYTGEVSVEMLQSIGIRYCVVGHSERREYFAESNQVLADKVRPMPATRHYADFLLWRSPCYPRAGHAKCVCTNPTGRVSVSPSGRTISNPHHCLRTHLGNRHRTHGFYRTGTRNAAASAFCYCRQVRAANS